MGGHVALFFFKNNEGYVGICYQKEISIDHGVCRRSCFMRKEEGRSGIKT